MTDSSFLEKLLGNYPQFFAPILAKKEKLNVQIIYTRIDRDKNGRPRFTDHYYQVDPARYFYPASTVKFPVAALALQRLHALKKKGVDKNTCMITETGKDGEIAVSNDPTAANGCPSIAHYIKKILLVSDNEAFNRLYEFLGQEYINKKLHRMGYVDVQLIHRLSGNFTEEQNRLSNPVRFTDSTGKTLYIKPARKSTMKYEPGEYKAGNAYMENGRLVNAPFDFSRKNRLSLPDLHSMLRSVIFPAAVNKRKRFRLSPAEYEFLQRYMSMYPRESAFPAYDTADYPDNFVKKFIYGDEQKTANPWIRIFNKTGTAYGFLTDASYIVDFRNHVEFFLTATIYCNSDGILNDDKYDYDSIGYPFFRDLGRIIYDYELNRKRSNIPDLHAFKFAYK